MRAKPKDKKIRGDVGVGQWGGGVSTEECCNYARGWELDQTFPQPELVE